MDELTLTRGDLRFHAIASGPEDGPLVLLLHGFPQQPTMWRAVVDRLAGVGYRAVAPAQRGYSPRARPRDTGQYRLPHLVDDVIAFADQLGPDGAGARRFAVVGHDWGGAVAWAVAAAHEDRVASAAIVSTPHPRAMRAALTRPTQLLRSSYMALFRTPILAETVLGAGNMAVLRVMLERSGLPPDDAAASAVAMRSPGALTAALRWYRAARPGDLDVGSVAVPTLFVWGPGDPALGRLAAERTADHVTGPYTFVPLEGAGHWIPECQPDQLADLLLAHLAASLTPSRPTRSTRR